MGANGREPNDDQRMEFDESELEPDSDSRAVVVQRHDYANPDHGATDRARLRDKLRGTYEAKGHRALHEILDGKVVLKLRGECQHCHREQRWPEDEILMKPIIREALQDVKSARNERLRAIEMLLKYGVGQPAPYVSNMVTVVSPEVRARLRAMVENIEQRESWSTADLLSLLERIWSTPGGET